VTAPLQEESFIIAGFGGQGVLLAGRLLAETALRAGKHVIWVPAYGPEVRGGTANCTVKVSDSQIGAVAVQRPDTMLVLNRPSFLKFEPLVRPGGLLLVNSSLVPEKSSRDDLQVLYLPASEIARELGSLKVTNMVMLGALACFKDYLQPEQVKETLKTVLPAKHQHLIPLNFAALEKGYQAAASKVES